MIHPEVFDTAKPLEQDQDIINDQDIKHDQDRKAVTKMERRWFGYLTAVVVLVGLIAVASLSIPYIFIQTKYPLTACETTYSICFAVSLLLSAIFFALILVRRKYLRGDPPRVHKMWPVLLGSLVRYAGNVVSMIGVGQIFGIFGALIVELIVCFTLYTLYFAEDRSESCCLCFKPWREVIETETEDVSDSVDQEITEKDEVV